MYNMFRLIVIALIITYFIGCLVYFIGMELNSQEDIDNQNTFVLEFNISDDDLYSDGSKLIIICYFALTTLSTVGYGDFYPISSLEMILCVVIMLGGVAFFSYIMGNFIEIISSYKAKMGNSD